MTAFGVSRIGWRLEEERKRGKEEKRKRGREEKRKRGREEKRKRGREVREEILLLHASSSSLSSSLPLFL
jgi:DNA invertase Pin-like site-specific DNA recombinase